MFKFTVFILAIIASACAKPGFLGPVAYSAPVVAAAPAVVTATSSQVIARNYNGIAAAPVVAAAPVAYAAPIAASYSSRFDFNAPVSYGAAPVAYAGAPVAYAAAPFTAVKYAAAPVLL